MDTQIINKIVKTRQIGGSYYILLDKDTRELMNLKDGTPLRMKLQKVIELEICCPKCKHIFLDFINNDPHDCPNCGIEILDSELEYVTKNNDINTPKNELEPFTLMGDEVGDIELKGGNQKNEHDFN